MNIVISAQNLSSSLKKGETIFWTSSLKIFFWIQNSYFQENNNLVKPWHRLLREVVDAPPLETSEVMLNPDGAVVVPVHCTEIGLDVLSNSNISVIL